jgi:hypothetical protein
MVFETKKKTGDVTVKESFSHWKVSIFGGKRR